MSWLVNPYMLGASINATGGYISYYTSGPDIFVVHKFIDVGTNTFAVSEGAGPVDYLIVAGGGSGGGGWQGGGGGGGGVLQGSSVVSQGNYSVVIGSGGISAITGTNGENSSAFGLTAIGGGRGAGEPLGSSYPSQTGGSGGGGSHSGGLTGSNGTSGQGTKGGDGHSTTGNYVGGGGGGASTGGANATSTAAGNGGEGVSVSITGTAKVYGSGGGGSRRDGGTQGVGGTGAGSGVNGTGGSGTPNTGAGGGSGWGTNGVGVGGAGGSGVVIIRYKIQISPTYITASGGNTVQYYTDYGNNKWFIHRFTATGSQNFVVSSGSDKVNYLIVAGGGAGGGNQEGGGGGAGGMLIGTASATSGTYPVVVGLGGVGTAVRSTGASGGNSSVFGITALGGGGGGANTIAALSGGGNGGSGGGGGGSTDVTGIASPAGLGTAGQGNNGGTGQDNGGAGGGGAGSAASNTVQAQTTGGPGGSGLSSFITGSQTFFAGGGGGSTTTGAGGAGGAGGGGAGGNNTSGVSGTANTGGGGGGASGLGTAGSGGSGIVVLRYPAPDLGIVTDNLSLYLDADLPQSYPASGTTWYDLGNGRNGTLTSGPTYATTNGGVINFDGIDDYVTGAIPSTAIANVTVQLWVNITGGTEGGTFFKQGNNSGGFAVGIGGTTFENAGTNLIFLFSAVRWAATTTSLGSGWKMVTMILNASSVISAYINDTPVASIPTGGNPIAPTTSYNLGRCIGDEGTSRQYLGGIATCMFYTSALTQAQVTQNFNAFRARYGL